LPVAEVVPVFKWRSQRQKEEKENKPKTKRLWGMEFNIVENGLDEEQVVKFVNELMRQFEASAPSSVRSILKNAIADAEKIVSSIKSRATAEAQEAAAQILAEAGEKVGTIVKETQAPGITAEFQEAPSALATAEQLLSGVLEEKAEREVVDYSQLRIDSQTPFTGEVELAIDIPVDLKMVSTLYSCLQAIPELRIVHTRGSTNRGTIITVVLNKPLPLISLISSKLPGVELIPETPEKEGGKSGSPGQGKKGITRRIKLVQKA